MAGYLITLGNIDSLKLYIENGIYGTILSTPSGRWLTHHEGTLADYATMKKNDNIYFFIKRKIYGIGELVEINGDCKFCNYPGSSIPNSYDYKSIRKSLLWDEGDFSTEQRWICAFKPSPYFFINGIDMDELLMSNPKAFKMLRAFWKVSFIKFDDDENQAFKDIFLKKNEEYISGQVHSDFKFSSLYERTHDKIKSKLENTSKYKLDVCEVLKSCAKGECLSHEMALEAGILWQLSNNIKSTEKVFGRWDYLSHQVVASPLKPVDYMDKMDIFGYNFIIRYAPTKSKYLVIEIKKDSSAVENVEQIMKYVDWVKNEYCYGDYSMIEAYLIAYEFPEKVIEHAREVSLRKYTVGQRPTQTKEWNELKLVKYRFNDAECLLEFSEIE